MPMRLRHISILPWISLFMLVSFLVSGCLPPGGRTFINLNDLEPLPSPSQLQITEDHLRIVVSPSLSNRDTVSYYRKLADHLAIQTGQPTELIYRRNNSEAQALLSSQGADLAFFSTGTFLTYNGKEPIEPLVIPEIHNGPFYQALIIVHRESRIENLSGLAGKRFAFNDSASFSGYLFPIYLLRLQQKTPEVFFSHTVFTQSHSKSLQAIALNLLDGAAIDSIAYEHARRNNPELANRLRIIHASEPIGAGPVVVRQSLSTARKELLKTILLNMHHNQDMQKILHELMIERFSVVPEHLYDIPRRMLTEMKLAP